VILSSLAFIFILTPLFTSIWRDTANQDRQFSVLGRYPTPVSAFSFHVFGHSEGMNLLERITIEPGKCGGRPCIRGYRMRVSDVLDLIAAGAGREEILEDYPFLEFEDITAALTYAAHQTDHTVLAVAV
jgi:uncharacterized protein (DUF433 family)